MTRDQEGINERRKARYYSDPEFRQRVLDSAKQYHKKKRETDPEYLKKRAEYNKKNAKYFCEKQKQYNRERPFKYAVMRLRLRAKQKDIIFDLDEEYLKNLWDGTCAIFGTTLSYPYSTERQDPTKATVDRVIPELGYTKGNVRWVSNRANIIKSFGTITEHEQIVKYMTTHKMLIETDTHNK